MMLWTQSHGLQGHKRLNRYESGEDRAHYIKIQSCAIDMFGEVLESSGDYGGYAVSAQNDIKGFLGAYVSWENSVYSHLANISRQLIELGFPYGRAELVQGGPLCKERRRIRRMLTEYGLSGGICRIYPAR